MSVINKMLNDLNKREKGQEDGVYHTERSSETNNIGKVVIVVLGVFVVLLLVTVCVFGYLYFMSKDSNTNYTASTEPEKKTIVVNTEENPVKESSAEELDVIAKADDDEEALAKLEDEIYGPDEIVSVNEEYQSSKKNDIKESVIEEYSKPVVSAKKVMKVTPVELTKDQEIELDTKAANIALSQGQIDKAIEAYQGILAKDPKNRKAREKMASLFYGTGNYLQARNVLQQGIAGDPSYPEYRLLLARIMIEQGNKKEALSVLTSLSLKAEQSNVDYLATEASLATEFNEPEIAIDAYSKLIKIMPMEGKWLFGLGVAFDRKGMKPAALSNYKRAVNVGLAEASHRFAMQRIQELEK